MMELILYFLLVVVVGWLLGYFLSLGTAFIVTLVGALAIWWMFRDDGAHEDQTGILIGFIGLGIIIILVVMWATMSLARLL